MLLSLRKMNIFSSSLNKENMNITIPKDNSMSSSRIRIEHALVLAETSLNTAIKHSNDDAIEVKQLKSKIKRYNTLLKAPN